MSEDVVHLREERPSARRIGESDLDARELEPGLHRDRGERIRKDGSEPIRCGHVLLRTIPVPGPQGSEGRGRVDRTGRDVFGQVGGLNDLERACREGIGLFSIATGRRDQRPLGDSGGDRRVGAQPIAGLCGLLEDGVRSLEVTAKQVGEPDETQRGRSVGAGLRLLADGELRVPQHRVRPAPGHHRPDEGHRGAQRCGPQQGRSGGLGELRDVEPAVRRGGIASQRGYPGPRDREPRIVLGRIPEPIEPGPHRADPAAAVRQQELTLEQVGRALDVPAGMRVLHGLLEQADRLEPVRGPAVQLRDHVGLTLVQLGGEDVAEQHVVAVPLPLAVEWDDEEVASLDRLQGSCRSRTSEDRVAERTAQALQDRGPGEEALPLPRERLQDLRADVVDDEPVLAGETDRGHPGSLLLLVGERRQVEADRPSLGRLGELLSLGLGGCEPGAPEEASGSDVVQGEVVHADLEQAPVGPEPGEADVGHGSRGDRDR